MLPCEWAIRSERASTSTALDLAAGGDGAARVEYVPGVGARHRREVDDARVRRVQAGDAARVGLDLLDAGGVDPAQAGHPVGLARRSSSSSRPSSEVSVATITFPQRSLAMPRCAQYS